jgi:hypothetical protein
VACGRTGRRAARAQRWDARDCNSPQGRLGLAVGHRRSSLRRGRGRAHGRRIDRLLVHGLLSKLGLLELGLLSGSSIATRGAHLVSGLVRLVVVVTHSDDERGQSEGCVRPGSRARGEGVRVPSLSMMDKVQTWEGRRKMGSGLRRLCWLASVKQRELSSRRRGGSGGDGVGTVAAVGCTYREGRLLRSENRDSDERRVCSRFDVLAGTCYAG